MENLKVPFGGGEVKISRNASGPARLPQRMRPIILSLVWIAPKDWPSWSLISSTPVTPD